MTTRDAIEIDLDDDDAAPVGAVEHEENEKLKVF